MKALNGLMLVEIARAAARPDWRDLALAGAIALAVLSILIGLFTQVWVAAAQLRRFSKVFAGRPDAEQALDKVLSVYGWRARLASVLFRIPIPPR
jgi:hypothetical protein